MSSHLVRLLTSSAIHQARPADGIGIRRHHVNRDPLRDSHVRNVWLGQLLPTMRHVLLSLSSLLYLALATNALHFYLDANEKRCFIEELPTNTVVEGSHIS